MKLVPKNVISLHLIVLKTLTREILWSSWAGLFEAQRSSAGISLNCLLFYIGELPSSAFWSSSLSHRTERQHGLVNRALAELSEGLMPPRIGQGWIIEDMLHSYTLLLKHMILAIAAGRMDHWPDPV